MDAPWQYRSLLPHDEADLLFARLVADVAWDERMKARKTASFGVPYDYSLCTTRRPRRRCALLTTASG